MKTKHGFAVVVSVLILAGASQAIAADASTSTTVNPAQSSKSNSAAKGNSTGVVRSPITGNQLPDETKAGDQKCDRITDPMTKDKCLEDAARGR